MTIMLAALSSAALLYGHADADLESFSLSPRNEVTYVSPLQQGDLVRVLPKARARSLSIDSGNEGIELSLSAPRVSKTSKLVGSATPSKRWEISLAGWKDLDDHDRLGLSATYARHGRAWDFDPFEGQWGAIGQKTAKLTWQHANDWSLSASLSDKGGCAQRFCQNWGFALPVDAMSKQSAGLDLDIPVGAAGPTFGENDRAPHLHFNLQKQWIGVSGSANEAAATHVGLGVAWKF